MTSSWMNMVYTIHWWHQDGCFACKVNERDLAVINLAVSKYALITLIWKQYHTKTLWHETLSIPDSKVHWANMGPNWVLSAPDGPHVGPMSLAIRVLLGDPSVIRGFSHKSPVCVSVSSFLSAYINFWTNRGEKSAKWEHNDVHTISLTIWWHNQMEIFSALLALCEENPPFTGGFHSHTGGFHSQRPVTQSFDVFFDVRLNKRLSKQSTCWWFETAWHSLWRLCNEIYSTSDKALDHTYV